MTRTVAQRSSTTSPASPSVLVTLKAPIGPLSVTSTRMATEEDAMRHLESDYDDNQDRWLTNVSGSREPPTSKRGVLVFARKVRS